MPFITPRTAQRDYDVIVVGSGAAGGQTAYTLAMEGVSVLMLEAGRNYDVAAETPMFQTAHDAPLRGAGTPDKPFGFYDATIDGGWTVPGEPYTNASKAAGQQFEWWRARMLGGRTNHWGRIALRNGPYDFKPRTRDGFGFDWPISYDDVAGYYDKVEMLIGVYGSSEGLENTPDSPEGCLQPAPAARVGERLIQQRAGPLGIPVVPIHRAVLTRPLDHTTLPAKLHPGNPNAQRILAQDMRSRAACFWATPCFRGCSIRATYQSPAVHLPPALATGKLDILCNAMVYEVVLDEAGKASGVRFVDKASGRHELAQARVVVLAASACESVRILLNSKSARFPNGLANSSGKLGRYIMDTVGSDLSGQIPRLENLPPHNEDGAGGAHVYAPWWLYQQQAKGALDFPRGYHIEMASGRRLPSLGTAAGLEWLTEGSYGRRFKEDARRYYGSFVYFAGRGEMIPNEHSYCDLDPLVKDRWGIPVLRFHWQWADHETAQAAHMQKTFAEIIDAMGGRVHGSVERDGRKAIAAGGAIIHEVGGAIMGSDPATSVTNGWCQTWDVKNLFITDGAPFCSNADKNPTLTIMALAWRAADYLVEQLRRKEI
ncbi:GMC family oxidoreductase [Aquincola sp. S2]|uniref:GMC family oxidoreductase n=1 Tax=Pseudaquabacterium terrae TaxID=2732868 RepID=A0ABX2EKN3_9BURK|nr:GMC family oxidoreductase [Aquabacterium terrae]NRF69164.1 GMC family oxidoreductase [Aquabacterium terrae]